MDRVRYRPGSDEEIDLQVRWGGNSDPRGVLTAGQVYEVERTEEHSMHTKVKLVGVDGKFNSFHFEWLSGEA